MMRHIADGVEHIYLAIGATDFRKQQNGLTSLVALKFKLNPHIGAITSAIIFSVINTATANNLVPFKYLEFIFRQLPNCDFNQPSEFLDEYLPWSEKMQSAFKVYDSSDEYEEMGELESEPA